jgi:hypothetical protein
VANRFATGFPLRARRWGALAVALAVIVPLFGALESAGAVVTTLYVDQANPACTDSGPGSATQPFCTIAAGATRAVAGQTVLVSAGTYAENVTPAASGTSTAPITFAAAPGALVTVGSGRVHGFTISSRSWITVDGFTVADTTSQGFYVTNASHVTITHDHVTRSGQRITGQEATGVYLGATSDSTIAANNSENNSDTGIFIGSNSPRNDVAGNTTSLNARGAIRAAVGIDVRSPTNTIRNNLSHDNEDSGMQFYNGANGNLVIDNVVYRNGDHGIDNNRAPNQVIVGNTVYLNVTSGINFEGPLGSGSTNGTVVNNIAVDNGVNSPRGRGNIHVDGPSQSGTTIDSNLVQLSSSGQVQYGWGSASYSSQSAFRAATGQEAHGLEGDPKWVNPGANDYRLLAGSPAIDSASSSVTGQPVTDALGNSRVDDPATPNTGIGTRTYDDRGAYEYQPTVLSYTTNWTSDENARVLQVAAYLNFAPEQLQKAGVQLIAFLLALSPPPGPTPLNPPPSNTGTVSYTTTWTPTEIPALQSVMTQYSLSPEQAQKFCAQVVSFFLALGGH